MTFEDVLRSVVKGYRGYLAESMQEGHISERDALEAAQAHILALHEPLQISHAKFSTEEGKQLVLQRCTLPFPDGTRMYFEREPSYKKPLTEGVNPDGHIVMGYSTSWGENGYEVKVALGDDYRSDLDDHAPELELISHIELVFRPGIYPLVQEDGEMWSLERYGKNKEYVNSNAEINRIGESHIVSIVGEGSAMFFSGKYKSGMIKLSTWSNSFDPEHISSAKFHVFALHPECHELDAFFRHVDCPNLDALVSKS